MDRGLLGRASDLLFGYDWFISYCWADGRTYAVALQEELHREGFSAFLDSTDYAMGDDWRASGRRALRKTSRLVLVTTPEALRSEPVAREIEVFVGLGRRVIPIDVDGTLAAAPAEVWPTLERDVLRIQESGDALGHGPSPDVIVALRNSFDLVRQQDRRARWMLLFMLLLVGLVLIAGTAAVIASQQRDAALRAEADAATQRDEARRQRDVADEQRRRAEAQEEEARRNLADSQLALASSALDRRDGTEALGQLARAWSQVPDGDPRRRAASTLIGALAGRAGRVVLYEPVPGWRSFEGGGRLLRVRPREGDGPEVLIRTSDGARLEVDPAGWALSPRGARMARVDGGTVTVRPVEGGDPVTWSLDAPPAPPHPWRRTEAVAFAGEDRLLVPLDGDQIGVYEALGGRRVGALPVGGVGRMVASPDGAVVLLRDTGELWQLRPPALLAERVVHPDDELALSDRGEVIVTTYDESPAWVRRRRGAEFDEGWGAERATQARFADGFAVAPSGDRVAIRGDALHVYDRYGDDVAPALAVDEGPMALLDDDHLVLDASDGVLVHVDLRAAARPSVEEVPAPDVPLLVHPARRPFGERTDGVVGLRTDGGVLVLDPDAGAAAARAEAGSLSPDRTEGVVLAGGALQRWRAGAESPAWSREDASTLIAWLSGDRLVAARGATLRVLDGDGAEVRAVPLPAAATTLVPDPGGRLLVVGLPNGAIVVVDTEEARVLHGAASAGDGPVAFDPSGRTLWTSHFEYTSGASGETEIEGVEPWTGAPLGVGFVVEGHVGGFAFDGDRGVAWGLGHQIALGDPSEHAGHRWQLPAPATGDLLEQVAVWTGRRVEGGHTVPMTRAEQHEALAARGGWPFGP